MAHTRETITVKIEPDFSRWKAASEAFVEVGRRWTDFERAFAGAIETMESIDSTVEALRDEDDAGDSLRAGTFAGSDTHEPDDELAKCRSILAVQSTSSQPHRWVIGCDRLLDHEGSHESRIVWLPSEAL